ncbi:MAG TPA: hypothetical protein PKV66_00705 [Candidatus Pelethenecus sp.]|nr:hypothetical protein [Candidatus Pelethenecus sp.]
MKNKILFSILSILGIAACFGLSLIPKEESPLPTTQSISLAAQTTTPTKLDMSTIREVITRAEMEEGFEMGGFYYQIYSNSSNRLDIFPVVYPEEVKNLFLFSVLFDEDGNQYTMRRSNLTTLEQYTNVENVISLQNNCNFSGLLSTIHHGFDFYSFGRESMNYNYSANIDKFYICAPYETAYTNPRSSTIYENLQNSKIKEIYFMDYTLDWSKPYVEDTTPITNSLEEEITISVQSTDDSIFSQSYIESVCAKIPKLNTVDFKANPYYTASTNVIDLSNFLYKISDINPKLKSFVVKENYFIEEETPELEDVIVEGNFDLNQFAYLHAKHLIYTKNPETVKINNTDLFDDVRFILQENNTEIKYFPIDTGESGVITTKSNPFYIPEGDHPEYNNLATYYLTKSQVQTYNPDDYTLKLKQFESDNGNIYYTNDETLSIDTLESYITEMTEGNFDFTTTEALDTQYQAYLETKPEVPTPTPSDNDDFVDESEFVNGYQALGSIYYTSSKSLDDILKIASNYILQKDGVRTDEEKEVSLHVDEDTLSVIIKVDGKIVASTVSKLHKLNTKEYGEFIYLQNPGAFYGVLLYDTTSTTTKTPAQIYDYLLNEITNAKTIPAPDFKDFSLTTPSSVDISSSLIHTNGNTYKVEMECLSFDLSQAKDLSNPDISHEQEDTPNNPDIKDKDKEETPNSSTDKDKDKEENKNQTDVKDEGTSNIFNDFKDNFENNKTFKTMSIILGTILGLVLIYVGYRIIKKIHKWLKK